MQPFQSGARCAALSIPKRWGRFWVIDNHLQTLYYYYRDNNFDFLQIKVTHSMAYPLTITAADMREINRSAILEIIRRESPISRTTIADRLDISISTVVRMVDELIEDGFVRLYGQSEWSGGRRRPLVEFNSDGYVVIGIDMGGNTIFGSVSDLGGKILDETSMNRAGLDGEQCYQLLTTMIDRLIGSPKVSGRKVRGIGVGAPGVTNHREGIVRYAYSMDWKDFPLKARLYDQYRLPITVDNDLNLAALGELWFGAGQNARNMILIAITFGIGAGIIIDRVLYRGSSESSGEIGNMIPDPSFLKNDYQNFGALESVASITGITNRAKIALKDQLCQNALDVLNIDFVFSAADRGEAWAVEIVDQTIDQLAVAVANLSVSFDPDLIIMGGTLGQRQDQIISAIRDRINGSIPNLPDIVPSSLGYRSTVMGAITNVLHNTSNFYQVQKLS
jgi:predicted NBD/HSP70 family sugar kinase